MVPYASAFSVMKYKRLEDEGTLRGKLHKFNIHSIRKKGDRFAGFLKILTGVEPQVKIFSTMFTPRVIRNFIQVNGAFHLYLIRESYQMDFH